MVSMARLSAASAASCTASDRVGCECIVRCRSSQLAWYSSASTGLGQQFASHGTDDVHTEHAIAVGIGNDLHEAGR